VPLRRGKYQLMLTRQGYEPTIHDFEKEPGKLKEIRLSLRTVGSTPVVTTNGNVRLEISPPGAQVVVNGILRGTSPLRGPLATPAGVADVQVSLEGYKPWIARIQVNAGNTTALRVQLVPANSTAAVTPIIQPLAELDEPDTTTGWALVGTGIGLSVGGALMIALPTILNERKINLATRFEIRGQQYISQVTRQEALDLEDQAKLFSYIGYGTLGVGVAMVIAGAVLVAQADSASSTTSSSATSAPTLSVTPVYLPGGGGASAIWRF